MVCRCLDQRGLNDAQNSVRPWAAALLGVGIVNFLMCRVQTFYFTIVPFFAGIFTVVAGSVVICCGPRDSGRSGQWLGAAILSSIGLVLHCVEVVLLLSYMHAVKTSKYLEAGGLSWHVGYAVRIGFYFVGCFVCGAAAFKATKAHQASGERAAGPPRAVEAKAGGDATDVV